MAMIKRLMRFRVLKEPLVVGGISLPKGDYDGEISWSELPFMHHQKSCTRSIKNSRYARSLAGNRAADARRDIVHRHRRQYSRQEGRCRRPLAIWRRMW
jgi:hypothetical protein